MLKGFSIIHHYHQPRRCTSTIVVARPLARGSARNLLPSPASLLVQLLLFHIFTQSKLLLVLFTFSFTYYMPCYFLSCSYFLLYDTSASPMTLHRSFYQMFVLFGCRLPITSNMCHHLMCPSQVISGDPK